MKKFIKLSIVITLISIQTTMYSQNFINDNKEWAILSTYSTKAESVYSYWTTYYKFSGDSIINGFSYHKLYKSTDSSQVNWTLSYFPLWWERNDSVFLRPPGGCGGLVLNDTTALAYDFNLEEGDTLKTDGFSYRVDSIRFLEWGGSIRKFWFFNKYGPTPYNCLTWIEGVGHFANFNFSFLCFNSLTEELLCFHENGNLVYQNFNYTNCYVYNSVPSITKSNEIINLSPNPATSQLIITLPENIINATYSFYDMQGCIQLTGKIGKTQRRLNVATLPRGLYILKIVTDKQIVTKKVMLQ